ncbi:antitoxin [Thiohalocapsa halophila]|uniref:antitoxin n=1 Tax=Thiohalocapsa halophila TaxID=69359 RepID=UPI001A91ACD9|nr:type II toxin-antitoxin system VapB family antitoxin [Thiohalocapsa halophila]
MALAWPTDRAAACFRPRAAAAPAAVAGCGGCLGRPRIAAGGLLVADSERLQQGHERPCRKVEVSELDIYHVIDIARNRGSTVDTAKIFQSGRSQAVRLPKAYRFEGKEVALKRLGSAVLLLPLDNPWQLMEEGLDEFEEGFVLERAQPEQPAREDLGE